MSTKAYDWVSYHARQTPPERLAMIDWHSQRRFTYAQMQDRTARLAQALRQTMGVEQGGCVALLTNNTTDFLEVEFACLKLGAIFVPVNWRLTVPELTYILEDCTPTVLIYEDVFAEQAESLKNVCNIPSLLELNATGEDSKYEQAIATHSELQQVAEITLDDIWSIMYTSGTTGYPKGATITYKMTFYNVINALSPFRFFDDMVNLCVMPMFHTGGLNLFSNPAIYMGGTNIVMRSFDPGETLSLLQNPSLGITHMFAVATVYLAISQDTQFANADLSAVRNFAIGGSPTPVELLKIYAKKGKALQQGYGMTETSPVVSALNAEKAMEKVGSAGFPVLHTEIRLVDENNVKINTPGTVGELWVKGPNITPGYWNLPDANESSFTDGWLHTGDAAYCDSEGYLYIADRWKDMYISGGENVYPAEVENVIYQLNAVAEVAVIGVPHERWGESGEAVVVVKPDQSITEEEILNHCREQLAKFKQPQGVRFVDEIPHSAIGKILKRELRG